jgi:glutamate racemase
VDRAVIARAVAGLRDQPGGDRIDTVVLACTHFPLLREALAEGFGPGVRFIDGAQGIARRIAHLTQGQGFARSAPDVALFTKNEDILALQPALLARGLVQTATI